MSGKNGETSSARSAAQETGSAAAAPSSLVVVGLGASAGGIEALREFFTSLPADSGMAFVVIQHLDPNYKSMMANLLSACTAMSVAQITQRTRLEPNRVYVTPPNKYVTLVKDHVGLTKPIERRGAQLPVNFFFEALALDKNEAAIGIVLSGTGADGSAGLRAIKENGGLCLAQDPKTAAYDAMPRNAINTGTVDYILPVEKMAETLLSYALHPYVTGRFLGGAAAVMSDDLTGILALMKARLKRDFSYYKKSTLIRRVSRRMGVVHADTMEDYLALLRKTPREIDNLFNDILIGVTQFFRDPQVFETLAETVIPKIVEDHADGRPIRVWVPGCSTGEEAYTLAMLLIEAVSARKCDNLIQVFATDIDPAALDKARMGLFPLAIEADISPKRLMQFFVKDGDHYRVVKHLREAIAFAEQNLISDPPFSKLDLISCRNLLIYVEPELQKKIMTLFHYTLNDDGYLLLGTSETTGRQHNLFAQLDKKARIYRRLGQVKAFPVNFPILPVDGKGGGGAAAKTGHLPQRIVFSDLTHRLLSETYAPASVLINRAGEPLYFFGPTDRYLKLPSGDLHQGVVAMARDGLATKLRGVIQKAVRTNEKAGLEGIRINSGGGSIVASVSVSPVREPKEAEGLFLIAFSEAHAAPSPASESRAVEAEDADLSESQFLERELQATREDLQSTIEEMETSNEELKAANEEAMSMNEELQSTNEELETSKEEMQSLNEELNTVNTELQDKVDLLEVSRNDIANLLASTNIGTLFLDGKLRIKRFTPAIHALFNIQPSDVGRKLSDFTKTFDDPDLLPGCQAVFQSLQPIEQEIQTHDGQWFARRILPYRTEENKIEGVVVTFSDVTRLKEAELAASRLATVVRDSNDAVTLQGLDGRFLAWNAGAEKLYGYSEAEALKMNIRQLVPAKECNAALSMIFQAIEKGEGPAVIAKRKTRDGRVLDIWLTLTVLKDAKGENYAVATTERDITDRLRLEAELRRARDELEDRVAERTRELHDTADSLRQARDEAQVANIAKTNFLAAMSHELRTPLNGILGYSEAILSGSLGLHCGIECTSHIRHIFDAGSHLHALINDILDISSVESGKLELFEETVAITEIVASCRRLVRPMLEKNDVTLRVSEAKELPQLFCDRRRLKQVLVNLISNAIKFAGGDKTVGFRVRLNKQGGVAFSVADKGIGMSREDLDLALQPFSQIDSSVTRVLEGTGLGLPIAKTLTEAHGGTLNLRSKPGIGTTASAVFPKERIRS